MSQPERAPGVAGRLRRLSWRTCRSQTRQFMSRRPNAPWPALEFMRLSLPLGLSGARQAATRGIWSLAYAETPPRAADGSESDPGSGIWDRFEEKNPYGAPPVVQVGLCFDMLI